MCFQGTWNFVLIIVKFQNSWNCKCRVEFWTSNYNCRISPYQTVLFLTALINVHHLLFWRKEFLRLRLGWLPYHQTLQICLCAPKQSIQIFSREFPDFINSTVKSSVMLDNQDWLTCTVEKLGVQHSTYCLFVPVLYKCSFNGKWLTLKINDSFAANSWTSKQSSQSCSQHMMHLSRNMGS